MAFESNRRPLTTAALIAGRSCSLAKSARIFAGATSLVGLNTSPVGPSRKASRAVMPWALNARLSSVFLTTRNCTFCSRHFLRSSDSFSTLMPVKSARYRPRAPSMRWVVSWRIWTFWGVGMRSFLGAQVGGDRRGVEGDGGAHGRAHREGHDVAPLRGRRTGPHQLAQECARIFEQISLAEGRLAHRGVHVRALVHPELDLARLELAHRFRDVEGHGPALGI